MPNNVSYLVEVCSSFKNCGCQKRLDYYVEGEVDWSKKTLVIEQKPCPFYKNEKCGLEHGHIGMHMQGYPPELKIYEKIGNKLAKIKPSLEKIVRIIHL